MSPYRTLRRLYDRYERWLVPGMLVVGMVVDFVTFKSLKPETAFLLLGVHMLLAGAAIAWMHLYQTRRRWRGKKLFGYVELFSKLIVQLSFGAMLSAVFIFYWFSSALIVSWPVIALVLVLMVFNEILKEYYLRVPVQLGIYFFCLFSIASIVAPYLAASIDPLLFYGSGLASLFVMLVYVWTLSRSIETVQLQARAIFAVVASIFLMLNALYAVNYIPPVPLSLRDAGVYHDVSPEGGSYVLQAEERTVFAQLLPGETMHVIPGREVYVFSAVWAPERLRVPIVHHWERLVDGSWESAGRYAFNVSGGREDGYRGYSLKRATAEGRWRVSVETERGQVIGRVPFRIEHVYAMPRTTEVRK